MLPSNKISQNFTNFQIHEDCVVMETESFIPNKEFNISKGLLLYSVLQKTLLGYYFMFSIKIASI